MKSEKSKNISYQFYSTVSLTLKRNQKKKRKKNERKKKLLSMIDKFSAVQNDFFKKGISGILNTFLS